MPRINQWQLQYPEEARLVGAILMGYGELEFELCLCVRSGMLDADSAFRAMFRMRSESQRIDVAEALVAPAIAKHNLASQFANALGALRHCKSIRNQYAHCHWHWEENTGLRFCDMEAAAKSPQGQPILKLVSTSVELLTMQVEFFEYCSDWLCHVHYELQLLSGRIGSHTFPAPKPRNRPKLHNEDAKNGSR